MLLESEDAVFIYNPTIEDKKTLPSCFPLFDPLNLHYSLAFDPMRFLGYKVICIFDGVNSKNQSFQTIIYSSESGVWKRGCSFLPTFLVDFRRATYFKDSIYWIGSKTTLRFDLKEECMKDDMPSLSPEPCHYGYILAPACDYMNLAGFESGEFSVCVFWLKEDFSSPKSDDLFSVRYEYHYSIIHLIEDNEDDMVDTPIHPLTSPKHLRECSIMSCVIFCAARLRADRTPSPSLLLQLTTIVDNNDNHLDANALFKAMSTPFSPLTASTARFDGGSCFFLLFFLCHLRHKPHNTARYGCKRLRL
ncbi:F-box protein [Arachis hypogaea]|nr:F-box protein [Arachis hypogaea]